VGCIAAPDYRGRNLARQISQISRRDNPGFSCNDMRRCVSSAREKVVEVGNAWRGQTNPSLGYRRTMPRRRKIRPS
jgi:hypothetical protein